MDGVTILSEMSVRGEELWCVIACVFGAIVMAALMISHNIECWHGSWWLTRTITIILTTILCAFLILLVAVYCYEYNTFHTEYKVTIDDSVCFNEFTERYEIISNNGDVYTVIDRQVD